MSKLTLIIGNKNYSSWSLRPWIVLKKLAIEFDEVPINLADPTFKADIASAGKLGGQRGLVPVLIDGDTSVWDSLAICEYLAEEHPSLWPANRSDRAFARSMVSEMHSGFVHLRGALPMNCRAKSRQVEISSEVRKDIDRIEQLWAEALQQHQRQGPWLFGEFSIADAFYAPIIIRFIGYDIALSATTQAYISEWLNDPSLQEWISLGKQEPVTMDAYEIPSA